MQATSVRPETAPEPGQAPARAQPRITIIGIGNSLMTDDGAGVHVAAALNQMGLDEQVRILDGGTLSFTLLDEVEDSEFLIIADAAELHSPPGTVQLFQDQEMDAYLGSSNRPSVHEVNLMDVLTAARIRGRMPTRHALVGIQPQSIGWGTEPSATVARAVDEAAGIIAQLVAETLAATREEQLRTSIVREAKT